MSATGMFRHLRQPLAVAARIHPVCRPARSKLTARAFVGTHRRISPHFSHPGYDFAFKSESRPGPPLDVQEPNRVVSHCVAPHNVEIVGSDDVEHDVITSKYGNVDGPSSPSGRVDGISPGQGSGDDTVIQSDSGNRIRRCGDRSKPGSALEGPVDRGVGKRPCCLRFEKTETNTAGAVQNVAVVHGVQIEDRVVHRCAQGVGNCPPSIAGDAIRGPVNCLIQAGNAIRN